MSILNSSAMRRDSLGRMRAGALCGFAAWLIAASVLTSISPAAHAQAVDCAPYAAAAERGRTRAQADVSRQEAATKEALDAAKECLARINRSLNQMIPGVAFTIDFSGLLRGMIDRACQVVTTRVDGAGRVINGTVSDASNRVIGAVNTTVGAPVATAGGVTREAGPLGASTQVVPPANPNATYQKPAENPLLRLGCALSGTCGDAGGTATR